MKMDADAIRTGLAHFTGAKSYTRSLVFRKMMMTDGVKWLADNAGAQWLVDAVAAHIGTSAKLHGKYFQTWTLYVRQSDGPLAYPLDDDDAKQVVRSQYRAVLVCTNGNSKEPLVVQRIGYTDFPLDEIKLVCAPGAVGGETVWVLMLTGEY